ncbi:hypothetical protein F511_30660 [Dorcoceras hygrometricum]|uniref:Uncharacterized protein n=1 Tax=Dorcoceras hygrometricum TaxID=472368 RepID=A0A2Z7B6H7_9LAMI|nr:hypothetical protein F511_30660 [Dorcoceras hygrometricum]
MPELDWSKIYSWNIKGTPKLVQQFTSVGIQWRIRIPFPGGTAEIKSCPEKHSIHSTQINKLFIGGSLIVTLLASRRLAPTSFTRKPALQTVGGGRSSIRSTTGIKTPSSACTRGTDEFSTDGNTSARRPERVQRRGGGGGAWRRREAWRGGGGGFRSLEARVYGPFYTYIPIRSTTIGKSRVTRDPIAMHISWRSNSDIASVTSIGYPRMKASGESSTTKHRLLHASGPHPITPPNDPKCLPAFYEIVITQVLLAEPLGSVAFKMVHVRQLMEEQQVKLETSSWVALCLSKAYVFRVSVVAF